MKMTAAMFFLFLAVKVIAQSDRASGKTPEYIIQLSTAEDNKLIGLLLGVKDSSVSIYPGKLKEWNANKPFKPVSFYYTQIGQISLQKKSSKKTGMLTGSGIGASLFAASFLLRDRNSRTAAACFTLPLIPIGGILGVFLGSRKWKKFSINSNPDFFTSFKNKKL